MLRVVALIFITLTYILLSNMIKSELTLYLLTVSIVISYFYLSKNIFLKLSSLFFFIYFFIPLMPISNYRGIISLTTMHEYSIFILVSLFSILLPSIIIFNQKKKAVYLSFGRYTALFVKLHLILVFLLVAYIYIRYGNIILHQELRMEISPSLGYIVKSSLMISLIAALNRMNKKPSKYYIFIYYIAPLLPAFLIGSRGTVIMTIISLLLIKIIQKKSIIIPYIKNNFAFYTTNITTREVIYAISISIFILYFIFYLRRYNSQYSTPEQLIEYYFTVKSSLLYLILPLYLNLRETIGLTNIIINNGLENHILPYPLILADFVTLLPGEQIAAGQAFGSMIGTAGSGGLTPGLFGGLMLDFSYINTLLFISIFSIVLSILYQRSKYNDYYLIVFALLTVQFFHLFHRGFFKPEYLFTLIIVFIYLFTMKKNTNKGKF